MSECTKIRMYTHLKFQESCNHRILKCLNTDVLILKIHCNPVVPTCIISYKWRDSVELYIETYLSRPRIFQVPELDMSITNCDKVVPIFSKWYCFHLGRHFVRSNLHIWPPVPHIHYHVMLGTNGYNIFVVWGESLKHTCLFYQKMKKWYSSECLWKYREMMSIYRTKQKSTKLVQLQALRFCFLLKCKYLFNYYKSNSSNF